MILAYTKVGSLSEIMNAEQMISFDFPKSIARLSLFYPQNLHLHESNVFQTKTYLTTLGVFYVFSVCIMYSTLFTRSDSQFGNAITINKKAVSHLKHICLININITEKWIEIEFSLIKQKQMNKHVILAEIIPFNLYRNNINFSQNLAMHGE